jgi:hypothetical protein
MSRQYTNRLLEMMNGGLLSAETIATMAVIVIIVAVI